MLNTSQLAAVITDFKSLVGALIDIVNLLIPLMFGIAFLAFGYGVIKYIYSANTSKIAEARKYIIFGIIGITVMLSVFAIALMLKGTIFPTAVSPVGVGESTGGGTNTGSSGFNLDQPLKCPPGQKPAGPTCVPDTKTGQFAL